MASVAAEATPEHMTAKATRNVKRGVRNARWMNSAAPPASGNLDTSSAYEAAVKAATMPATANATQIAPPISPPTSPTSA